MSKQSSQLEVRINYATQSFLAIIFLVLGLLLEYTIHGKWIQALAGIFITLSIAVNLWYLLKSSKKLPITIETHSVCIRGKQFSAESMGGIVAWKRTKTIFFSKPNRRLSSLQIRADDETFETLLIKLNQFAKTNHLSFDVRTKQK